MVAVKVGLLTLRRSPIDKPLSCWNRSSSKLLMDFANPYGAAGTSSPNGSYNSNSSSSNSTMLNQGHRGLSVCEHLTKIQATGALD